MGLTRLAWTTGARDVAEGNLVRPAGGVVRLAGGVVLRDGKPVPPVKLFRWPELDFANGSRGSPEGVPDDFGGKLRPDCVSGVRVLWVEELEIGLSDLLWKPPVFGWLANGRPPEPSDDLASIGSMEGFCGKGDPVVTDSLFACVVGAPNLDAALPGVVTLLKADLARLVMPVAVSLIPVPNWLIRFAAPLVTLLVALPTLCFRLLIVPPIGLTCGVVAGPPMPNLDRAEPVSS